MKQTNHKRPRIQVHDDRREAATAAGFGSVGWHTFRHSHRSLHSKFKTPLDIQQALLRHASISTTVQYGGPPLENQREANSIVVREILKRRSSL